MVVEAIKCAPIKSDSRGNGFRGPQDLAMDLYNYIGPWYGGTTRVLELRHWSQFVTNMSTDIRGHEALHHQWYHRQLNVEAYLVLQARNHCKCNQAASLLPTMVIKNTAASKMHKDIQIMQARSNRNFQTDCDNRN